MTVYTCHTSIGYATWLATSSSRTNYNMRWCLLISTGSRDIAVSTCNKLHATMFTQLGGTEGTGACNTMVNTQGRWVTFLRRHSYKTNTKTNVRNWNSKKTYTLNQTVHWLYNYTKNYFLWENLSMYSTSSILVFSNKLFWPPREEIYYFIYPD